MEIIKFRRPFFTETTKEFSHFGYWGVKLGNTEFTSPPYNNQCSKGEDQMFTGLFNKSGVEIF